MKKLELMVKFKKETPKEIKYISNWFNSGKFVASPTSYFDKKIYTQNARIQYWKN